MCCLLSRNLPVLVLSPRATRPLTVVGGGIMAGRTLKSLALGEKIVIGGLIIQSLSFGFFLFAATIFHVRLHINPSTKSREVPWRRYISTWYAASILILIRSIFRVVEYVQGDSGYLLGHEVFLYIFDAVFMFVVMVLLNCVHPSGITKLLRRGSTLGGSSQLHSITSIPGRGKALEAESRSEGLGLNGANALN